MILVFDGVEECQCSVENIGGSWFLIVLLKTMFVSEH